MPVCTVVIPCFNGGAHLTECLSSLAAQTYTDWEAVVVDDASTDGDLPGIVARMNDDRIRYIRHDRNLGPGAARNSGIRAGSGELIFTLDSDDRLEAHCIERLMDALAKDAAAQCAYPDLQLFGERSGIWTYDVKDVPAMLRTQWIPGPGCLFERNIWARTGGYCEDPILRTGNEDWEFYIAAVGIGLRAVHVPGPLYEYRVGPESTIQRTRHRYDNAKTREFILDRHRALFDRYRAGSAFLAEGYRVGAWASLARGERSRALRLAFRACTLDPKRPRVWKALIRALTPEPIVAAGRRIRATGIA